MKVHAIGDLHLEGSRNKPMDLFGANWHRHFERVSAAWQERVGPEDLVLIPGDISWAMNLEEALPDLEAIHQLPGKKVILRGNHDYWWSSLAKLRRALPPSMQAIQNDSLIFEDFAVAGSRGWLCPGAAGFTPADERIYQRELVRLDLSLKSAGEKRPIIAMLHYPPFNERREESCFEQLLLEHGVSVVVYGHLHGRACKNAFEGERNGIRYHLCSADHLDFAPKQIL